jgi:hypothetical protein
LYFTYLFIEENTMSDAAHIPTGSKVRTQFTEDVKREEWTEVGWERKRWGVEGVVTGEHNSHGQSYDVTHEDGTNACYDPEELEVLELATN